MGETKLEGAVTTDICGKKGSHAARLDAESPGPSRTLASTAKWLPSSFSSPTEAKPKPKPPSPKSASPLQNRVSISGILRLPWRCHSRHRNYSTVERNRYRFSSKENLNKRFADRRATIQHQAVQERIREEIQKVFAAGSGV